MGVQKLTKLWISEGFIPKQEVKAVEIVAREYVMDLVGRSLLIVTNRSSRGGIKACRIHDLLREFCLAKCEGEHFLKLLHGNDVAQLSKDAMDKNYQVCIQTQHWRSFLVWNSSLLHSMCISPTGAFNEPIDMEHSSFFNARFLHVLNLEDVKFHGDFPEEISKLFLLRYLAIWCTTKYVPGEIVRLGSLETLHIKTDYTCILPAGIMQLENLRHVNIGKFLPHALFANIVPMKTIQSFSCPCLTYGKETEIFLSKFQTVRKLKCQFRSNLQNQMAKLDFLNQLESLNMTHEGWPKLHRFGFSLPTNLKTLMLSNFGLPWTEIASIVKLQNLEVLKLLEDAFMGKYWKMEDEKFKRLKFLKLQSLNIGEWNASDENFPLLEQMVVEQCHKLEKIPTTFGDIPTLRMIQVQRCRSSVANSALEIQEQRVELGNKNSKS